jgi:ribosome-associated protein
MQIHPVSDAYSRGGVSSVFIPESELQFSFSRSGGAGGQNVNKVETKVSVIFDVECSRVLTEEQKQRVIRKAGERRILHNGRSLIVTCQEHRSQHMNRVAVVRRVQEIVRELLMPHPERIETLAPPSADLARRLHKEQRSEKKARRREGRRQSDERE